MKNKGLLPRGLLNPRAIPPAEAFKPILAFAPPLILSVGLRIVGYTVLTRAATCLGTINLAAHQILVGLFLFLALLSDALYQTVQVCPSFPEG